MLLPSGIDHCYFHLFDQNIPLPKTIHWLMGTIMTYWRFPNIDIQSSNCFTISTSIILSLISMFTPKKVSYLRNVSLLSWWCLILLLGFYATVFVIHIPGNSLFCTFNNTICNTSIIRVYLKTTPSSVAERRLYHNNADSMQP